MPRKKLPDICNKKHPKIPFIFCWLSEGHKGKHKCPKESGSFLSTLEFYYW